MDSSGVLKVTAKDKATGKENSVTVTGSSGLTDDEISKMVSEAEADNIKNKDKLKKIKSKNILDSTISQTEKFIKDNENVETSALQVEIESAKTVVSNESATKEDLDRANETLMSKFQEIGTKMYEQNTTQGHPEQNDLMDEDVVDAEFTEK